MQKLSQKRQAKAKSNIFQIQNDQTMSRIAKKKHIQMYKNGTKATSTGRKTKLQKGIFFSTRTQHTLLTSIKQRQSKKHYSDSYFDRTSTILVHIGTNSVVRKSIGNSSAKECEIFILWS